LRFAMPSFPRRLLRLPTRAERLAAAAGRLFLLLPLLLPAACGSSPQADAEAIRSLVRREVEAINKKDLKTLSEVWSQDKGILLFDVPPPGRFQGWETVGRLFKDFFDRFSEIHLTIDRLEVEAGGQFGYATYDWTLSGRMGEYAVDDRGEATSVYRKEKDGWRLVHAHYSPSLQPPAPAPAPASATPTPAAK